VRRPKGGRGIPAPLPKTAAIPVTIKDYFLSDKKKERKRKQKRRVEHVGKGKGTGKSKSRSKRSQRYAEAQAAKRLRKMAARESRRIKSQVSSAATQSSSESTATVGANNIDVVGVDIAVCAVVAAVLSEPLAAGLGLPRAGIG
jgi:hypothetical protein